MKVEEQSIINKEYGEKQQSILEDMKMMLADFGEKIKDIKETKLTWQGIQPATNADIDRLFHVEGDTLIIGNTGNENYIPTVGKDNVGSIPVDSAFLLVYAAEGDGRIMRNKTLGSPVQITTNRKQFMADGSQKESARWQEALDRLIQWGWVKSIGGKGIAYELTGTGYNKAEWLKDAMQINTDNEPLEELKEFD